MGNDMNNELKAIRDKLYSSVRGYKVNFVEFFEAMDALDSAISATNHEADQCPICGDHHNDDNPAPRACITGDGE